MLKRGLDLITKRSFKNSQFKSLINAPMFKFSTLNLDGLKNILKSEISHEESNYQPVDQNELKTFFQNTKFSLHDSPDSLNVDLKKTVDNFDVIVNFQAKAPIPTDENQPEQGETDKSKYKFNNTI